MHAHIPTSRTKAISRRRHSAARVWLKIQRITTKQISTLQDKSYRERLSALSLPSLSYRRLRGDLKAEPLPVFNHNHNHYCCDKDIHSSKSHVSS